MDSKLLRVKATLNAGEIRRFSLPSEERNFSALEKKLKGLFSLPEQSALQVSYFDEEGDEVVFSTDDEMAAFPLQEVLRLHIKDITPASAPTSADAPAASIPSPLPPTSDPPASQSPQGDPLPAPFGGDFLPPQPGRVFHPPPFTSAPLRHHPHIPPHHQQHHVHMGPFSAGFSLGGNLHPRRVTKLLIISFILASLCSAFIAPFLLMGLASPPPPQHPPSSMFNILKSAPPPTPPPLHHLLHHAASALFMAFALSVILSLVLAAVATYLFSKTISSFAATFSQNTALRQQRLNEFTTAFSQLLQAFASQQPQPQPQPQNQPPQGQPQNQPQSQSSANSQAQFQPPPYEGIRHRTHSN